MLAYMQAEAKKDGTLPGMTSYRLMCAFVEAMEALHAGDTPSARQHHARWRAIANQLLERQLFDDEPLRHAVSMSTPGLTVNGADGVAMHMARMIQDQQDVMVEAGVDGEYRLRGEQ